MKRNVVDVIFTGSLIAIAGGFFWAWPPLGLIVPGLLVCGIILLSRLTTPPEPIEPDDANPNQEDRS